jgi:hypothetical protein
MPNNRITTSKLIQQQAKGVATSFVSDVTNTFVNNLFRRKQPPSNILSRRDNNVRLSSIREYLYQDNKTPASEAIYNSPVNPYAIDVNVTTSQKPNDVTSFTEWRVRLDLGKNNQALYRSPLISPLFLTGGVVFPFTPQLVVTHNANYTATPVTHANFQHYTYSNSDIGAINISGDFTAQNQEEGAYLLAVIHFFRSVTKMFFGGDKNPPAGTPPPILFLTAYGTALFNRVPVVVTSFTSTFPSDVNYLYIEQKLVNPDSGQTINTGQQTRVPTMMNLSVTVQPVFNRQQSKNFSLDGFVNGKLLTPGYI